MSEPQAPPDHWGQADPYERYVGRWSRRIAPQFLQALRVKPGATWADIGCGTGALTQAVLDTQQPRAVRAVDRAPGFVATARQRIQDPRVQIEVADAVALPLPEGAVDAAVSGLVLNFVEAPARMVAEMARVTRPGGCVAAYVWDYGEGMQMMRRFWDAAAASAPPGTVPDEASRFPICAPGALQELWSQAGLQSVESGAVEIPTVFEGFDDYWQPFLGGQGAAPTWLAAQDAGVQEKIRATLERSLPRSAEGRIALTARAWTVKGTRAG